MVLFRYMEGHTTPQIFAYRGAREVSLPEGGMNSFLVEVFRSEMQQRGEAVPAQPAYDVVPSYLSGKSLCLTMYQRDRENPTEASVGASFIVDTSDTSNPRICPVDAQNMETGEFIREYRDRTLCYTNICKFMDLALRRARLTN